MRLIALSLQHYGNFRSETLAFDPAPGVVNLIVAPNGAGKSVLRSAFCDLLFGIGGQTPMGFRYGYAGMRIGAEAIDAQGRPFAFGRRKGHGNTLVDADGAPVDPARIAALLGRTDRTQLERLFALDTERLRQGEAELLSSNGVLADALEAGAGGVRHARRLRQALEEQRDKLAPSRKSAQRPFYVAVDRYTDARRRISASLLKPEQWEKWQQELTAERDRQAEQNRIADDASRDIARLERIRRVTPWLVAHDAAAAWLADHPDAPALDPALKPALDDSRSTILVGEERLRNGTLRRDQLAEQLRAITVDAAVLAEGEAIDALTDPAGAARKATADLPARQAELAAREAAVQALLRELGSALPVDRAGEAIPSRAVTGRARRLLRDYAARTEAVRDAPARIAAQEQTVRALQERIAALPATADHAAVADLLKEIGADGDPARRRHDSDAAETQARAALDADLARVHGWTGGVDALLALAPLPPESYADRAKELDAARVEVGTRLAAVAEARQALDTARLRLDALTGAGRLPEDADLQAARARRDAGWTLIYRHAFTPSPPPAEEIARFADALPLPLAYQQAVEAADRIADERVAGAAAIEQVAAARRQVQEAEQRLHDAGERHRLATETVEALQRVWSQLCTILPLGPSPTVREVHAFLAARDRVIEAVQKHRAAEHAREALGQQHAAWSARLTVALGLAADPGLDEARADADRRVAAARKAEADRAAATAQLEAAEKALADARERRQAAEQELAAWRREWEAAAAALGRPDGEDPHISEDLLQVMADLDQAQKDAAALRERVAGMTADNARFRTIVTALAARLSAEQADGDPFAAVQDLRRRLQEAREGDKQRGLLREQHAAAAAAVEQAERQLAEQRASLAGLLLRIGADTEAQAETRLALAAERARHAAILADSRAQLPTAGDGLPVEQLREEIAAVPPDEIAALIEHAVQTRRQAQEQAQHASAEVARLSQEIARAEADAGARDAAADQHAAVATIGRVLEEALVLHTASELLRVALTAVEQSADSSALRRIGALFAALTDGAYARVMADAEDDAGPRLILVQRAFPEERQAVRDLSEGTRDQLYLALRLAAIEAYAQGAPALPFIGDDILQTFDDDRALAALRVLCEVSATAQVILLTHHRHLADLAGRLPAGSVNLVRLGELVAA